MDQRLADKLAPQRFHLLLIGSFAASAIILAALGVYGVMSYLVTRRTREIGIRVALGARPEQIERLVLGETVGLAVGCDGLRDGATAAGRYRARGLRISGAL